MQIKFPLLDSALRSVCDRLRVDAIAEPGIDLSRVAIKLADAAKFSNGGTVTIPGIQPPPFLDEFQEMTLNTGAVIFQDGDPCENFFFVVEGSIRVDLINADGKSILLYRVGAEETCILSTSCLISEEAYCAQAVAETKVKAIAVPKSAFQTKLRDSESFRQLVFRSFSSRLSKMMATIDEVSFASLDRRLARRLLGLQSQGDVISITHEQLANDLGSAREVVSRKLQDWEKAGLISRGRGSVCVNDRTGLQIYAGVRD